MNTRSAWSAIALISLVLGPVVAHSQDKDEFRNQAKDAEAALRQFGEPKDRCSIGAFVADGPVVSRVFASAQLMSGDRLVRLNGADVVGKKGEDIVASLRVIAPTAVLPATVERAGQRVELTLPCANARAGTEALLLGLNQASRGKFDECVSTFSQSSDFGSQGALIKVQCASYSRNAKKYDVPALVVAAMKLQIEDAHWVPAGRPEVIKRLRATEGMITPKLGAARFNELVEATRLWPGGETLYEASTPDWAQFRRNAEAALRARLIDPDSARIEWPYGFLLGSWRPFLSKRIEGYWTCGSINARNRMGGYTGSTSFVVVLEADARVKYVEVGEAKDVDLVTSQCNNSVALLPPPAPVAPVAAASSNTPTSIADELKKLVELKNSGALTDTEFQAAKQRLLGTSASH